MDSATLLSLRNVGVSFPRVRPGRGFRRQRDAFWALKDVSFDLYEGEALGVIGRNGAGKTTLMRLLAGILVPDRGTFTSSGVRSSLLSLNVGMVPHLSGRENIVLSGMLLGLERRQILDCMDAIIAFAELEEFIDDPVSTYSSGMKARLGFATAFQIDPDVLLIDEVLGVGDAAFAEKSSGVLREKIRSHKTVVLVSHNAQRIRNLCDRAVWLDKGVTRAEGSTDEVITQYSDFLEESSRSGRR
ncbi:MAG: ABC transporter ATP-binding protein [Proteobacteria bacterium]|nr:ABC transporter ATP-binding protein [Pseudomonadota bacterium]